MRVHRVFVSFAISIGCGIASQNVAFSQEYRGTAEQQMACTPDVWRLCGAQSPMWTESWRACGEILHNSANHAVR